MKAHNFKQHLADFGPIYLTQAIFTGCFYGIRAILVLYAIRQFSLSEVEAITFFSTFMILCYGTSLIGGYIADKGLGVKNTVMLGGVFSALGLLLILLPLQDLFLLGLALAALGSGFVKPNITTAIGLLFRDPKDPRKDRVYSILYIAMNFGNLVSPIICGFVGKTYGWGYGISLLAALFMGAVYFVYKTMHFHSSYKERMIISKFKLFIGISFLLFLLYMLFKYQEYIHGLMGIIMCGSIVYFGEIFYQCNTEEKKDILKIVAYILLFALFCTLYEQAGTSLMLFFERAVDRHIMGIVVPSSAFLSFDPLFVLFCGPILLFLTSKYLEKTRPINGFIKTGFGFLWIAASFGILALSTFIHTSFIPFLWIIGAFFVQTIGELWIAPVSFSKISQYAPPRYKSVLMSFWQMAIAYGHYCAGFIAQFSLPTSTPLSFDNSFENYQSFFVYLGIVPLCVGFSLLLCQWGGVSIMKKVDKNGLLFKIKNRR